MEQVFGYIIALGASVMMPIIFTIIGMCHRYEIWQGSEIRSLCRSRFCGLSA